MYNNKSIKYLKIEDKFSYVKLLNIILLSFFSHL